VLAKAWGDRVKQTATDRRRVDATEATGYAAPTPPSRRLGVVSLGSNTEARSRRRPLDDDRLVELARAGCPNAFAAIVDRYRVPLERYVGGITGPSSAEDVVQQTFEAVFVFLRDDARPLALKAWLYRVAHNRALHVLDRRDNDWEELDEQTDGVAQPFDIVERRERLRGLLARLRMLPDRQRSAIVLRELEGRSYDEIAATLGATEPVVRALLYRARRYLRAPLGVLPWFRSKLWAPQMRLVEVRASLLGGGGSAAGDMAARIGTTVLTTGAIAGGGLAGGMALGVGPAVGQPMQPAIVASAADPPAPHRAVASAPTRRAPAASGGDGSALATPSEEPGTPAGSAPDAATGDDTRTEATSSADAPAPAPGDSSGAAAGDSATADAPPVDGSSDGTSTEPTPDGGAATNDAPAADPSNGETSAGDPVDGDATNGDPTNGDPSTSDVSTGDVSNAVIAVP
jgi:RNA polymerase sigma factor (sigma-70 family)